MKEKFNVYGEYDSKLENGKRIIVNRGIVGNVNNLQEELELALKGDYIEGLKSLQEQEQKVFEELKNRLDDWQKIAEQINILQLAKKYEEDCKEVENIKTTNNEWIESEEGSIFKTFDISNKTYAMFIRIYESTKWDRESQKSIAYKWEVSYNLHTNNLKNKTYSTSKTIASIDRKSFKDKESAYKYIEGRKKYFNGYFTELYQPIKDVEEVQYFTSCGKLLKGYRIEE